MKKIFFATICAVFFLPVTLASCKWIPLRDYSPVLSKTTYKNFDSLNEPILISFTMRPKFDLKGQFFYDRTERDYGSVYVIYDWENDSVYDYFYSKGDGGYLSEFPMHFKNGGKDSWVALEKGFGLHIIDPAAGSETELNKPEIVYNSVWSESNGRVLDKALLFADIGDLLFLYDASEKTLESLPYDLYGDCGKTYSDGAGSFWTIAYMPALPGEEKELGLCKVPVDKNGSLESVKILEPHPESAVLSENNVWSETWEHDILHADENFILLSRIEKKRSQDTDWDSMPVSDYNTSLVLLDLSDKSEKTVSFPQVAGDGIDYYYVTDSFKVGGIYYLFAAVSFSEDVTYAFAYDPDTNVLSLCDTLHYRMVSSNLRGNRIYLAREMNVSDDRNQFIALAYFDTGTRRFSRVKKLGFLETTGLSAEEEM